MSLSQKVSEVFRKEFSKEPKVYSSPGRINLIGEHTDYNNGFVLPAAIDKAVYIAIAPSGSDKGKWISVDFNETVEIDPKDLAHKKEHWANYIQGIVEQFQKRGNTIAVFDCVVAADLPVGAGMSSSAALEACVAFALNEMNGSKYDRLELAKLCQRSENEFIGVHCGIMDMYASLFGKADHIIKLDCRSLEHEYFPLVLDEYELVLFDTNVKHSLASSEYNVRRQQCEEGVSIIKRSNPSVESLRDVSKMILEHHGFELPELVYKRCKYVIEENERLISACAALLKNDLATFGTLMYASHNGLQNEYEVSCDELDFLVDAAKADREVLGARMMGGGFGGCAINLIKKDKVQSFYNGLAGPYQKKFNKPLTMHEVSIGEGTHLIQS